MKLTAPDCDILLGLTRYDCMVKGKHPTLTDLHKWAEKERGKTIAIHRMRERIPFLEKEGVIERKGKKFRLTLLDTWSPALGEWLKDEEFFRPFQQFLHEIIRKGFDPAHMDISAVQHLVVDVYKNKAYESLLKKESETGTKVHALADRLEGTKTKKVLDEYAKQVKKTTKK